jgi:hypothetical protein
MDKVNETRDDREIEYVAPAIVDYGTLVEVTAANQQNQFSDVQFGALSNHGLSQ